MKILFLLHQGNMYSGGQGVYTSQLTRELVALGHDVHLIVGPPWPEVDRSVHMHRAPSYSVHPLVQPTRECFAQRDPLSFFEPLNFYEIASSLARQFSLMHAFSWRAFRLWRELQPCHRFDIVHDVQALGYGTLMIHASGMPVVANVHHPLSIDRTHQMREATSFRRLIASAWTHPFVMQEIVARRMDRVITGSEASRAVVSASFRVPAERIVSIHDGVDTHVFRPLGLPRRAGGLIYVGNSDDANKGVRYLLDAAAILRERGVNFHLTIVDRPTATMAPRMVRELSLQDRVTFPNNLRGASGRLSNEELACAYNEAQLAVAPSLYEGFGLPAAEAMACGAPVVATRAGALPEVVADGETGVLVPPRDARALADAIERLLGDPQRCAAMGAAGARRITEQFSWRMSAERTVAAYDAALDEWAAANPATRAR